MKRLFLARRPLITRWESSYILRLQVEVVEMIAVAHAPHERLNDYSRNLTQYSFPLTEKKFERGALYH